MTTLYTVEVDAALAALQVLVLTPATRAWLTAHDPKALAQAETALRGVGLQAVPRGPQEACWYCGRTNLDATGSCRDCAEDLGRALDGEARP